MPTTRLRLRRNQVDERIAAAIAVGAGLLALLSGAEPTGNGLVDVVLVAGSAALVAWASASAPWWALIVASGIAGTVALDPLVTVVAFVGFAIAMVIGVQRRDNPELRAVVGAITVNALLRSQLDDVHGLSAVVGVVVGVALVVLGARRRPSAIRRPMRVAAGLIAGVGLLAIIFSGLAVNAARSDVVSAADYSRDAVNALNDGDYDAAARLFDEASSAFTRANTNLGGALASPGQLVPVLAQNMTAGADLSSAAADATAEAAAALRAIDVSSVRVVDGEVDIASVRALEAPLVQVQVALEELRTATDDVESPWLVEPLQRELDDLDEEFDRNEPRLQNAVDAVRLAPQFLGAEGERRYLVLFTTPSEARGLGGFIGNYAEVTVDGGRIEITDFDRRSELQGFANERVVYCDGCPEELIDRYGRFGLNSGENGAAGTLFWLDLTMAAHYPYVAEAAAILYPQSGGRPVDGVIVMDPYVVEELMQFTGPIDVPELGTTVAPDDAAEFILREQYLLASEGAEVGDIDQAARVDGLEALGTGAIAKLLTTELPDPPELARRLAPLVSERRLLFWTDDEAEQALLDRTGLLGSLPPMGEDGGFSVSVTNGGHSKIDVFLERETTVDVVENADGTRTMTAEVRLTNGAPAEGLPSYVIGNDLGFPVGTSRLFVTFYGPEILESVTLDGEPIDVEPSTEAGWSAYGHYVLLPAGGTGIFRLEFTLPPGDGGTSDVVRFEQPLAARDVP